MPLYECGSRFAAVSFPVVGGATADFCKVERFPRAGVRGGFFRERPTAPCVGCSGAEGHKHGRFYQNLLDSQVGPAYKHKNLSLNQLAAHGIYWIRLR
jgi:hypothetical protein